MNTAAAAAAEEGAAAGRSTAADLAVGTNMAAAAVDIDLVGCMGVGAVVEPDCCSYHLQMMSESADSVHQQIAIADQQEEEEEAVVVVEEVAIFEWWACVVSALAPLHPKP
jgi:hypothetical protein